MCTGQRTAAAVLSAGTGWKTRLLLIDQTAYAGIDQGEDEENDDDVCEILNDPVHA